jgi:hypothetical protein
MILLRIDWEETLAAFVPTITVETRVAAIRKETMAAKDEKE